MIVRGAMLIGAVALLAMAFPASANALAQEGTAGRPAKAKRTSAKRSAKVARAVPVATAHTNFFATPLGLLTAVGGAGGAGAGAAALAAQGSASSPQ